MPNLDPKKKRKAFRLRLQKKSLSEIARTLHMSPVTVRHLEYGWTDKKGVRHRGWREELEQAWKEQEKQELMCGLALKEERIKVYKRLAQQAAEKIETQFPNIQMEKPSDYKAITSEWRELCRLLRDEVGPEKGAPGTGSRQDVSADDVRAAFKETKRGSVAEIGPPEEAHYDPPDDDEEPEE